MSEEQISQKSSGFPQALRISQGSFVLLQVNEIREARQARDSGFVDASVPRAPISRRVAASLSDKLASALREHPEFATVGGKLVDSMFGGQVIMGVVNSTSRQVRGVLSPKKQALISIPVTVSGGGVEPTLPMRDVAEGVFATYKRLTKAAAAPA